MTMYTKKNCTSVLYQLVTLITIFYLPLLFLRIFSKQIPVSDFPSNDLICWISFCLVHHYRLFPKVIADLVRSNGVSEFHVALTQGLWRYDRWGMPIVGAPPGAEVWTWFKQDDELE